MKKVSIFIILVLFWMVLLFPKATVWKNFAGYLETKDIKMQTTATQDLKYKFIAKGLKISYKGMDIAQIKSLTIKPWLLYDEVNLKTAKLNKNMPILKGLNISQLKATYDILHPTLIRAKGGSGYGDFTIVIRILKHKGAILLKSNHINNSFLRGYFKKTEDGMRYEFSY